MPDVVHNAPEHRFELRLSEGLGRLDYRLEGTRMLLLHTAVPEAAEGQGHASALTRAALDHAREAGLEVVPLCPFARAYLERHPEEGVGQAG